MKAFVVDRYKSKSAVRLGEMPEPEVRDDDVLVQVHAASLNQLDRKSTRLNSSHGSISYAVFCLKKKKDENYDSSARSVVEIFTTRELFSTKDTFTSI